MDGGHDHGRLGERQAVAGKDEGEGCRVPDALAALRHDEGVLEVCNAGDEDGGYYQPDKEADGC